MEESILSETALVRSELIKPFNSRNNAEDVEYSCRAVKFLEWMLDSSNPRIFKLTSGEDCRFYDNESQTGSGFEELKNSLENLIQNRDAEKNINNIRFEVFVKGEGPREITLKNLQKTSDFGSTQETSIGSTVDMESMTAIYCALECEFPNYTLIDSVELLRNHTDLINSHLRGVKVQDYFDKLDSTYTSNTDWSNSFYITSKVLDEEGYLGKNIIIHRQSKEVRDFSAQFKKIESNRYSDINKWNPADIWLLKEGIDFPIANDLKGLNKCMSQLFENKNIVGVSLKKVSEGAVADIIEPQADYQISTLIDDISKGEWRDSPGSGKLVFPEIVYLIRCFQVREKSASSFAIELSVGKGHYRDGKAGLPAINYEIKRTGKKPLLPVATFTQLLQDKNSEEFRDYVRLVGEEITGQKISKYYYLRVKEFYESLETNENKYNFLSGISAYALSRTSDSCPHIKVH